MYVLNARTQSHTFFFLVLHKPIASLVFPTLTYRHLLYSLLLELYRSKQT